MSFISFWGKKFFLYHTISYSVSHIYSHSCSIRRRPCTRPHHHRHHRLHVLVLPENGWIYFQLNLYAYNLLFHFAFLFISQKNFCQNIISLGNFIFIYLLFNFFPAPPLQSCIKWPGADWKGPEGLFSPSLRDGSRVRGLCAVENCCKPYVYKYLLWSGENIFSFSHTIIPPHIFRTFSFAFSSFSFRLMILQLIKHAYIYIVSRWIRIKSQNE